MVKTVAASEIERAFALLPGQEQCALLERLIQAAQPAMDGPLAQWDAAMVAMAADPEMRREIAAIGAEFREAESDGLKPA